MNLQSFFNKNALNKITRTTFLLVLILTLSACASQLAFNPSRAEYVQNKQNLVYMGTRESIGLLNSGGHDSGLGLFALPASFVGDTLLLPWSIPVSLYHASLSHQNNRPRQSHSSSRISR